MGDGGRGVMNLMPLISMGGYGIYVWPAYCITLAVLGLNGWLFLREKKHIQKIIRHESKTKI